MKLIFLIPIGFLSLLNFFSPTATARIGSVD